MVPRLFLLAALIALVSLASARAQTSPPARGCATADDSPQVLHAAQPSYPASALAEHLGEKMAYVVVTVDSTGKLVDAGILQTSGNAAMDISALAAARASTFAPAIVNCVPVKRKAAMRFVFAAPSEGAERPTFNPPAGWTEVEATESQNGPYHRLATWRRGADLLMVSGSDTTETFADLKVAQTLTRGHAKILENKVVKICHGSQQAALAAFILSAPDPRQGYWLTLIVPDHGTEYLVAFYSGVGHVADSAVVDAMMSACVPGPTST
jgi:TonB family protein